MFFRRVHWASWGLTAGSLLASSIGCMGTAASTGGWPGLSWMRWGRPDPAAVAAKDGLNPPSITTQPDYPQTEQAAINSPGAPAVANNVAPGGAAPGGANAANRYLTGNYPLGAANGAASQPGAPAANPAAAPGNAAPGNVAAAGGNQGFYDQEYRGGPETAAAPMNPPAYGPPAGNLGGGAFDPSGATAGGYDPNASPASYQDPAAAGYAAANAAQPAYQPQPGAEPAAPTGMNPDPAAYAPPSSDAAAAYAAAAGYGPSGNAYGAGQQPPASGEGGATGYIEDNSPAGYAAQPQPNYTAPEGAGVPPLGGYQPAPGSTARSVLPGQLPNVNPQAGLTGLPPHRTDPRYRPGSARDFFPADDGAASTAAQPGVQPAGYYGNR